MYNPANPTVSDTHRRIILGKANMAEWAGFRSRLHYQAGQFGLISPNQRPLFLSTDPGLQFTPPASFIQSVMAGSAVNAGRNLECQVRR